MVTPAASSRARSSGPLALTAEQSGTWSPTVATSRPRPSSAWPPYLAPQSTPWATSSPASATATPAPIHRGGTPAVPRSHWTAAAAQPPASARLTAAAGTANGRAWEAGYPSATAPTAPAAVVNVQASARAGPGWSPGGSGSACGLAPDRWRQARMAAARPAATSSQVSRSSAREATTDPRPGGRPRSHAAWPAPSSWPATQTGRTSQRPTASPSAAMSRQASW